jgi:hypothetical protein
MHSRRPKNWRLSLGVSPLLPYNYCSIPFKSAPALLLHPRLFLPPQEPKLLACASFAIFSYCPSGFRGSFILPLLLLCVACIMHGCVISTMFGSCFWFLKKTFIFSNNRWSPLPPRPGPSHF